MLQLEQPALQNNFPDLPAITVSIGISSLKEDDKEVFDIIKRSDQALYAAKKNGRNQVQIL
jgi:diguanylate cyclase (GGDEF)-like protein